MCLFSAVETRDCNHCKEVGHIERDCPQKKKVTAHPHGTSKAHKKDAKRKTHDTPSSAVSQ